MRGGHVLFVTDREKATSLSEVDHGAVVCTQDFEVVTMAEALREFGEGHGHAAVTNDITVAAAAATAEEDDERKEENDARAAWESLWGAAHGRLRVRPDGHIV